MLIFTSQRSSNELDQDESDKYRSLRLISCTYLCSTSEQYDEIALTIENFNCTIIFYQILKEIYHQNTTLRSRHFHRVELNEKKSMLAQQITVRMFSKEKLRE